MRLRNELDVTVVALVAIQVLTSFAAIGLLARTGPAVERILTDNVESVGAVEEMVGALALADDAPRAASERFGRGLARARANVTEEEERPLLDLVQAHRRGALAGNPEDVRAVVTALDEISAVNRRSMERTDARAQRYGYAGAWTMAILGVISFGIAVGISRRLVRRVDEPLAEIDATLAAARGGDAHRRAEVVSASEELVRIAREVNDLLDARRASCAPPRGPSNDVDRATLVHLLTALPEPTVLVDAEGRLHAANAAARDRLAAPDGGELRKRLDAAPSGATIPGVARVVPVGGGVAWLLALEPAEAEAPRAAEG